MLTAGIALAAFAAFAAAYFTYGRWLSHRVFQVDPAAETPSHQLRDGVDYVPTKRGVVFGHHFTSIAGTGPIVGPAIAVFWGWLPALLWVVVGAIFIGAVHDFGALMISLRNRGQTIGEVAGRLISPRARLLFLLVLFFALTVVLAIFGLVIATIFKQYPSSVLSVWLAMPLAVIVGWMVYKRGVGLLWPSLAALGALYGAVWLGAYGFDGDGLEVTLPAVASLGGYGSPIVLWTTVLLAYCFIASVLPVWVLLQPRDYINSQQLMVAMALLVAGLFYASASGLTDLANTAPAIVPADQIPVDAPPILPFLFITIACGACSGFHCLVSSGTTSKQVANEADAPAIGYGGMLLEGALAVVVILSCCAGVGIGVNADDGSRLVGAEAWRSKYQATITQKVDTSGKPVTRNGKPVTTGGWKNHTLPQKVGAFVEGGGNFVSALGAPTKLAVTMIAVLVACFAATTLDTATRLQRYVIQEIAGTLRIAPLRNKYAATGFAVVTGGAIALVNGGAGPGSGGLILWPLFGATNQLLAGLALMVLVFYLARRGLPFWFAAAPAIVMLLTPGWAMGYQLATDFVPNGKWPLVAFGLVILGLQLWMIVEAALVWPRARGVLEKDAAPMSGEAQLAGGRSC